MPQYFALPVRVSGLSIYAILSLRNGATVWNGTEFVAYDVTDWADYVIETTEGPSGIYKGVWPTGFAAGYYEANVYQMLGIAEASTDTPRGIEDLYLATTVEEPEVPIFSAAWKLQSPETVDNTNETLYMDSVDSRILAFDLTRLREVINGETVTAITLDAVSGITRSALWAEGGYCGATIEGDANATAYTITGMATLSGGGIVALNRKLLIS